VTVPLFFDTHAHLDQDDFDADRAEVIARATAAGVLDIICVGVTAVSSAKCIKLAAEYPALHAAVGIQPNYVHEAGPGDWETIVALASQPNVVALGETGLDRYWDHAPFDVQQDYFDRHLRLSQQLDLPFIVHMRDCGEDILVMLREARTRGPLHGIMHSYTGDPAMAAECVDLGLHISFAGMVTYKKSDELRACAATIPAERLLIETDSPYLSPQVVRGIRRNEPAHVVHTAACLAEVRGQTIEELAAITTANAKRLFRVD
jgi:TatD DNase family protein